MATFNHKIEVVNGNTTDTFHPQTNTGQVYDFNNSAWLNSIIGTLNSLTTTQKSSLVASINEIAGTKASSATLTAHISTIATTSQLGHVKPDGTTITIDANGVISSVGGGTPDAHTHPTSQITGLDTALGLKAPLTSPAFVGTPTASTAPTGTRTTQIATTAFVHSSLTDAIDSPSFTGTPTAPTAATTTNTRQIATTAFVQSNVNAHLNDYMPHESSLSQTASSMDSNGVYTVVEFKRADNTLYMRSTATNPNANGYYQTITWQFYASNGTTLSLTKTWSITYNSNGLAISKVVV